MTYSEFQIELIKIGLSIKDLASLIGMHPNTITNYKSKEVLPLNLAIVITLLAELKTNGIDAAAIIEKVKRKHFLDIAESKN